MEVRDLRPKLQSLLSQEMGYGLQIWPVQKVKVKVL